MFPLTLSVYHMEIHRHQMRTFIDTLSRLQIKALLITNSFTKWFYMEKFSANWGQVTLIHTSVIWVSIGSCNDLLPVWHQVIPWTNADLLWTDPQKQTKVKFESKYYNFLSIKHFWKCRMPNSSHFVSASIVSKESTTNIKPTIFITEHSKPNNNYYWYLEW